jgi:hypothetical protein
MVVMNAATGLNIGSLATQQLITNADKQQQLHIQNQLKTAQQQQQQQLLLQHQQQQQQQVNFGSLTIVSNFVLQLSISRQGNRDHF